MKSALGQPSVQGSNRICLCLRQFFGLCGNRRCRIAVTQLAARMRGQKACFDKILDRCR